MKVLIAYDGSPASAAAVEEVAARPWPEKTSVRLVTIVEKPLSVPSPSGLEVYTPLFERICSSLREEAHRRIHSALMKFETRPDLLIGFELREGSAKDQLLKAIAEWNPDVVFAGLNGRDTDAAFPGSVCYHLVTRVPCCVEIVKPAGESHVPCNLQQETTNAPTHSPAHS